MKKLCVLFLSGLLLFFAACGARSSDDAVGRYVCMAVSSSQTDLSHADVWLQLEDGGSGVFCRGEETEISWRLDGECLTVTDGTASYAGVLSDGVLTLTLDGEKYTLTRAEQLPKELPAAELLPELANQVLQEDTSLQRQWNGNWYGWWEIHGATGGYSELENRRSDLCARVEIGTDASGTVTLWDEEHSAQEPLGKVRLSLEAGKDGTDPGIATSKSGYFAGDMLEYGDWVIEPTLFPYENMLLIEGARTESSGSYNYSIFLRPWGLLWSDIESTESEQLPYRYFDWYLPALEANAAMPDTVGGAWRAGSQGATNDPTGKTASVNLADGHLQLAYSTSRYQMEANRLVSLSGGARLEAFWCADEEDVSLRSRELNTRRDEPAYSEQKLELDGHPARRVEWYDEKNACTVVEYLIDAGSVQPGAAVYLNIALDDAAETAGIQTIIGALRLR